MPQARPYEGCNTTGKGKNDDFSRAARAKSFQKSSKFEPKSANLGGLSAKKFRGQIGRCTKLAVTKLISGELPMKSLLTYVAKNRGALSHTFPPPLMASKRGRPAKKSKRNTSGLKSQDPEELSDYGDQEMPNDLELDSIVYLEVDTDHDDVYDEDDWEQIATAKFKERLLEMVLKEEEDKTGDSDWLPSQERSLHHGL
ncbi:hypothetical protein R3P38DRAFT_2787410 [Favolaschia claudopus]|uniref:Uncharacterized protein n=1 Tax=Favolaschia claudopus TaxID=2862362 RepID=A0AAW0A5M5_9AGAR